MRLAEKGQYGFSTNEPVILRALVHADFQSVRARADQTMTRATLVFFCATAAAFSPGLTPLKASSVVHVTRIGEAPVMM